MKKIILIGILFSFFNFSYSQKKTNKPTRSQTVTWLSEKINKYLHKEDYITFEISSITTRKEIFLTKKNINFKFTDKSIIITYDVERLESNKYTIDGIENEKTNYSEKVELPLKNITNKVFIKDNYLVFQSNYNSFIETSSEGSIEKNKFVGFKIDPYEENDFINRFNKAMNHLLSFVEKSSKSSEIF